MWEGVTSGNSLSAVELSDGFLGSVVASLAVLLVAVLDKGKAFASAFGVDGNGLQLGLVP